MLTGTPAGVGPLAAGDHVEVSICRAWACWPTRLQRTQIERRFDAGCNRPAPGESK